LDHFLNKNIIKYAEVIKIFLYFVGFKKEEINYKGTNVLNWIKSKKHLTKELII
jgi:hypothetical protein